MFADDWDPTHPYAGPDTTLQALYVLRNNVIDNNRPIFQNLAPGAPEALRALRIAPTLSQWQDATLSQKQLEYLDRCINVRILELVDEMADTELVRVPSAVLNVVRKLPGVQLEGVDRDGTGAAVIRAASLQLAKDSIHCTALLLSGMTQEAYTHCSCVDPHAASGSDASQ